MRWRAAKSICSPRRSRTDGAFFIAVGARELQVVSRFVPEWPGLCRDYLGYGVWFWSGVNSEGLTEVYLRFTLACNIEPNAGLENNRIDSLSLGRGLG